VSTDEGERAHGRTSAVTFSSGFQFHGLDDDDNAKKLVIYNALYSLNKLDTLQFIIMNVRGRPLLYGFV
jgi:hypothetical protein